MNTDENRTMETAKTADRDPLATSMLNGALDQIEALRAALNEAHIALSSIGAVARLAMTKDESTITNGPDALIALQTIATTSYRTRALIDPFTT